MRETQQQAEELEHRPLQTLGAFDGEDQARLVARVLESSARKIPDATLRRIGNRGVGGSRCNREGRRSRRGPLECARLPCSKRGQCRRMIDWARFASISPRGSQLRLRVRAGSLIPGVVGPGVAPSSPPCAVPPNAYPVQKRRNGGSGESGLRSVRSISETFAGAVARV